jgi:deoxycytidine triphosphate deaminase
MLLNALEVEKLLQTNDKGAKAQVGYDLTLKGVKKINGGIVMSDKTIVEDYTEVMPQTNANGKLIYKLEPGTYSLTFDQGVKLPTNRTAFIRHRSSILRCGGIITSGVYDPGFEVDEMGGVMFAHRELVIEKGARVAQIIMMENTPADLYDGQFQGTKDVK